MQIANPIYDVVFKYLLEDKKVAKLFLSAILEKEIIDLEFKPQEYTTNIPEKNLTVYRLDFKAKIRLNKNETKVVLIELQKAKHHTDLMRFRRYLGKQYANEDNTIKEGIKLKPLPIITIYFIAYPLEELKDIPIIYIKREYIDKSTNKIINKRSEFIEILTHDSIIIQIEAIKNKKHKNRLEKILSIFDTVKKQTISINENDYPSKYQPIIRRLIQAIADDEIRETMQLEDDILEEFRIREEEKEELERRVKEEEKRRREEEQRRREAEERTRQIEEEKKIAEEKLKQQKLQTAKTLLKSKVADEIVQTSLGLTKDEIEKIKQNIK